MRAIVQRVSEARVVVEGEIIGEIGPGLVILVGIHRDDSAANAQKLSEKILRLRIFADEAGRMNRDVLQTDGGLLIVSQFTLYGDTTKGNRPSYSEAAGPEKARELYDVFIEFCRGECSNVQTGRFQAHMQVHLVNDGPVTLFCRAES